MTRDVSKAAIDAMTDAELVPIVCAFTDVKTFAGWEGVPYADAWQLHYRAGDTTPWRIIDRRADPGHDGTGNIAIALQATTVVILHIELTAYRQALGGISEIRHSGISSHLLAPTRR